MLEQLRSITSGEGLFEGKLWPVLRAPQKPLLSDVVDCSGLVLSLDPYFSRYNTLQTDISTHDAADQVFIAIRLQMPTTD